MALRSTASVWGPVVQAFHWGMLLLLLTTIPIGYYMADLPLGPPKLKIYALHKSIGITLLALAAVRLLWRLGERRPAPSPMPGWQRVAAQTTHVLLYVLLFVVPLSGWLYNSAAGFPLQWFRLFNLPALTAANPALKVVAKQVHETGVAVLIALVVAHAVAALKHHFIDRDATLRSMLPLLRSRP